MLKANDLMSKDVYYVLESTKVSDVAKMMKNANVGIIPICTDDKRMLGVITDRDLVLRNMSSFGDDVPVSQIMSTNIISGRSSDSIYDISNLMAKYKLKRIPIVDKGKLVGIISISDIAKTRKFNTEIAELIIQISE